MVRLPVLVFCAALVAVPLSAPLAAAPKAAPSSEADEMFAALDKLDALDREEMTKLLDEAMRCVSAQNFGCADTKIAGARKRAHGQDDREAIQLVVDALNSERAFAAQIAAQEQQFAQQMAQAQADQENAEREDRERRERRETACRNVCFSLENQQMCIDGIIGTNDCRQIEGTDDSGGGGTDIGAAQIIDNLKRGGRTLNQLGQQQIQAMQELAQQRREAQAEAQREMQRRREQQAQAAEERRQQMANAAQERQQASAQRQQQMQAARAQQDAERVQRAADAKARLQQAQEQEKERQAASNAKFQAEVAEKQRVAKAAQDKADATAKKAADAQADLQAKQDFLDALARGTKLTTKVCYGDTFVVGIRPKVKPEKVACVDVEYRVQCPGAAPIDGAGLNFVGIGTDCITGDTFGSYKVHPSCKEPAVSVRRFTECR
ncbi:MAG: hypothetical protein AB7H70_00080 [Rhodospirillaceae bacterium]